MIKKILYFLAALTLVLNVITADAAVINGRFYPILIKSEKNVKSIDNLVGNFDKKITIIFSDIDGTLIPLDKEAKRGTIPKSVIKAFKKLKKANIPLILATGRSSGEARQIAQKMGNGNTYVIGQQGAEIVDSEGNMIYEDGIKNSDTIKMITEIKNFNKANNQDTKYFIYSGGNIYAFEDIDLPYLIDIPIIINSFEKLPSDTIPVKVGMYDENIENLKAIQNYIKQKFPNYNVNISADCYCDISSLTASKGKAVKKLAEILNIDLSHAAVIGDAQNDVSMLKEIKKHGGLTLAIGNAMPSVRENADFITNSASQGGFKKAMDEILRNNKKIKN